MPERSPFCEKITSQFQGRSHEERTRAGSKLPPLAPAMDSGRDAGRRGMTSGGRDSRRGTRPAGSERHDPADLLANQLAREVFSGEAYWWKRTSDVQSTSAIGRVFFVSL